MTQNEDTDLTVTRIIKAPPAAVWRAWSDPEHLVKWWAPAPLKTISSKHEFYAGGGFGTIMIMPDGQEMGGEACFLEVVENQRIVFSDALRGGWRPNEEAFFSAIIRLEEHPEGTQYTATAVHKNPEDRQKHADMGFLEGWGTCIEQLGKLAEQLKT